MSDIKTTGRVLHFAAGYDLVAWLFLRGKERQFRDRLLNLAEIRAGDSVLDIGCGTGSLAIAAKQRLGPAGAVEGIDRSPAMIARSKKKAKRRAVEVSFGTGVAEALPFPDGRFDVTFSTLMLHHLPEPIRPDFAREMRRVLKPGGRALVVDLAAHGHWFASHGGVELQQIVQILTGAGFEIANSGAVGFRSLHFVLAKRI